MVEERLRAGRAPKAKHSLAVRTGGNRRAAVLALAVIVLIVVISTATGLLVSRQASSGSPPALAQNATPAGRASSPVATAPESDPAPAPRAATTEGDATGAGPRQAVAIELEPSSDSAEAFETVRLEGSYPAGGNTYLRVQRWEGGRWLNFPLPTKTDQSGRFTAYVELGQPGQYRLRVADPESGVESEPFVLVVRP